MLLGRVVVEDERGVGEQQEGEAEQGGALIEGNLQKVSYLL